ncbi:hypothetical protein RI129_003264 [Pyrocoelia pectoralis]|uniref:DDE Tnp4 domain-containing protein n=1 Tax=Pyrocoelia pectoralis TaxID=417401 RepID=A0AAN7VHS3_9COLE
MNVSKKSLLLMLLNYQEQEENLLLLTLDIDKRRNKELGMFKNRRLEGFQSILIQNHLADNDTKFKEFFRILRHQYNYILRLIEDELVKQWINVAVNLPRFLQLESLTDPYLLGSVYSIATLSVFVPVVLKCLYEKLMPIFLPPPSDAIFNEKAKEFWNRWNFPNLIAAIDGKHVRIMCPDKSGSLFFNYKNYFSIVLLALVDANYKFLIVDIGSYGKEGDAGIFSKSQTSLLRQVSFSTTKVITTFEKYYSTSCYILQDHGKAIFNYRLSRAGRVTENCFGIFCNTFRIFFTPINVKPATVDLIIGVSCCLHNMLRDEYMLNNPRKRHELEDTSFPQPTENMIPLAGSGGFTRGEGFHVRSRFTDYFINEGTINWQDARIS